MLVKFSFAKSRIVLSLVLVVIFAAGIGPVQASDRYRKPVQPPEPPPAVFDGSKVNEYMDECQSVMEGSVVDCMNYAFTLAGANNLAATGVQSEQFALSVNDIDSLSGAFDGSKVNEYMDECQSVLEGSVVECLDYAFEFAAPDVE